MDADEAGRNWLIDPPTTNIPTLIVSGTYDATTPPAAAAVLLETLPNAKLMYLKGRGHYGTAETDSCSRRAMMDFLKDPDNFEVPDCIGQMTVSYTTEFKWAGAAGLSTTLHGCYCRSGPRACCDRSSPSVSLSRV